MNLILITLTTKLNITVAQNKSTQFFKKIIVHQDQNITASVQIDSFLHTCPKSIYATQSMAQLTMLYDKPFQVLVKHCLRSAMTELASDTFNSATHALY